MRAFITRAIVSCSCSVLCATSFAQPPKKTSSERLEVTAWKVLTDGVAEDKAAKKADAIAALGTIGPRPKVVRLVEASLADGDPEIRQKAAVTLGQMKSRPSIPKLRETLEDKDPNVRLSAACALWEMGDHSGRGVFIGVLSGDRSPPKETVQSSLQTTKKKLRNPLQLGKRTAKESAQALLGPFALGLPVAEELMKDRTAQARVLSATYLATDREPQSVREFEDALADKNWMVRSAAAKAAGVLSRRELIPKLRPLLDDEKDAVRYMAAASIVRLSQASPHPTYVPEKH